MVPVLIDRFRRFATTGGGAKERKARCDLCFAAGRKAKKQDPVSIFSQLPARHGRVIERVKRHATFARDCLQLRCIRQGLRKVPHEMCSALLAAKVLLSKGAIDTSQQSIPARPVCGASARGGESGPRSRNNEVVQNGLLKPRETGTRKTVLEKYRGIACSPVKCLRQNHVSDA